MIHALALSTRGISSHIVLLIRFMAPGFLLARLLLWELCLSLSFCSLCFEEHWKAFMQLCCNTACGHTLAAHARSLVLQGPTSSRWKRSRHRCCCEGTFQTTPKELLSWLSHQSLLWDVDTGMQPPAMQPNALTVQCLKKRAWVTGLERARPRLYGRSKNGCSLSFLLRLLQVSPICHFNNQRWMESRGPSTHNALWFPLSLISLRPLCQDQDQLPLRWTLRRGFICKNIRLVVSFLNARRHFGSGVTVPPPGKPGSCYFPAPGSYLYVKVVGYVSPQHHSHQQRRNKASTASL